MKILALLCGLVAWGMAAPLGADGPAVGRVKFRCCEPYAEHCRACVDCSHCGHCHRDHGFCSVCLEKMGVRP